MLLIEILYTFNWNLICFQLKSYMLSIEIFYAFNWNLISLQLKSYQLTIEILYAYNLNLIYFIYVAYVYVFWQQHNNKSMINKNKWFHTKKHVNSNNISQNPYSHFFWATVYVKVKELITSMFFSSTCSWKLLTF